MRKEEMGLKKKTIFIKTKTVEIITIGTKVQIKSWKHSAMVNYSQ